MQSTREKWQEKYVYIGYIEIGSSNRTKIWSAASTLEQEKNQEVAMVLSMSRLQSDCSRTLGELCMNEFLQTSKTWSTVKRKIGPHWHNRLIKSNRNQLLRLKVLVVFYRTAQNPVKTFFFTLIQESNVSHSMVYIIFLLLTCGYGSGPVTTLTTCTCLTRSGAWGTFVFTLMLLYDTEKRPKPKLTTPVLAILYVLLRAVSIHTPYTLTLS